MSRGNIDHIAIAPSGVYVIDCKRYKGKIAVATPLFGKPKLKIAGRDRTKVPVHGCLCFVAPEGFLADVGLLVLRTLKINGYPLYYAIAKRLEPNRPDLGTSSTEASG